MALVCSEADLIHEELLDHDSCGAARELQI